MKVDPETSDMDRADARSPVTPSGRRSWARQKGAFGPGDRRRGSLSGSRRSHPLTGASGIRRSPRHPRPDQRPADSGPFDNSQRAEGTKTELEMPTSLQGQEYGGRSSNDRGGQNIADKGA